MSSALLEFLIDLSYCLYPHTLNSCRYVLHLSTLTGGLLFELLNVASKVFWSVVTWNCAPAKYTRRRSHGQRIANASRYVWLYLCATGLRDLLMYVTDMSPSLFFWVSMALRRTRQGKVISSSFALASLFAGASSRSLSKVYRSLTDSLASLGFRTVSCRCRGISNSFSAEYAFQISASGQRRA